MSEGVALDKVPQNLVTLLKQAQKEHGYLSPQVIEELAGSLDMPVNEVYGVATFYSFLSTRPLGRNVIRVCKSVPCYLKHNQATVESIEKELGIRPGQTTPDGRFSLEMTNCIGLCDHAPAMMINDDPHVDLNPGGISKILGSYK